MNSIQYIGMDLHSETLRAAVVNDAGKVILESTMATEASAVLDFVKGVQGTLQVAFEEGIHAEWLYSLLVSHVAQVVACDPRQLPPGAPPSYGLGVLVADFNNDSFPDIYVANDSEPSYLFWNKGGRMFVEGGMAAGAATSEDGRTQSGMGVTAGDYNADGLLDIFKTNFSNDLPNLYRNLGGGFFEEVTREAGLGAHTLYLGWGCGFFDADNDGWLDLFYINGHVYPEVDRLKASVTYREPMVLYHNFQGERFEDVSNLAGPVFNERLAARGCAFGDFDNDGSTDILVNPINDVPRLLKYQCTSANNWITLKLIGTQSNRSAIGARVRCVTGGHRQIDEVRSGGSFMSQNDLRVHFGLGKYGRVDLLEISWPSSHVDRFGNLTANQIRTFREGQGEQK